jgi:hypothetical protein
MLGRENAVRFCCTSAVEHLSGHKTMVNPPPIVAAQKKKPVTPFLIAGAVVVLILVIIGVVLGVRFVFEHGITDAMDRKFGDQNLKSTVALLELHKVRFGKYPDSLKDLKYTGEWDQIWINGTRYYPSKDRLSYYVEVERGWIGKPTLVMPDGFWQNTGYNETLKPTKE